MIANEGIKTGEHEKRRLLSTCCAIIILLRNLKTQSSMEIWPFYRRKIDINLRADYY